MTRPSGTIVVPLLFAFAAVAGAQEQDLPPGAKSTVRDLVFKVEDFGAKSADFQVKETDTELRIELSADVLFDFDKATVRPQAEDSLSKAAALLQERAAGAVRIEGHTDGKGDAAYNQRLSGRRAESVRQWLVRRGMGHLQFAVQGFGETRPVAPNTKPDGSDDPDGRQKNRRVEIVISKQG